MSSSSLSPLPLLPIKTVLEPPIKPHPELAVTAAGATGLTLAQRLSSLVAKASLAH